jgi:iron complex transport system substrate-binding protein
MKHGSVIRLIERAETRSKRTDALVAVHLQIENVHGERVTRLSAFDKKRASERIVALRKRESVTGLLNRVAKAIEGVGLQNVSGVEPGNRRSHAIDVFHGVNGGVVAHDFGFCGWSLRDKRKCKRQQQYRTKIAHVEPPRKSESAVKHTAAEESMRPPSSQFNGLRVCYSRVVMKKRVRKSELRIVSLAPSATSILCAIGARRALVGVTKWCADVAPVDGLPKLGDCWRMEAIEDILRLKPTLVIGSVPFKQETVAKLLEQPLNFLAMNPRTLADIENDIRLLGGIVGRANTAEQLVKTMRKEFARVAAKSHRKKRRIPVYCEAWPNPRISSPPWVAELVTICGGEMVVPAGEKVSEEQVAEGRPEVIVLAWAATGDKADPEKTYAVKAWQDVPAVRDRRVYVVRDELLNTPGPPLVRGAQELWNMLHWRGRGEREASRKS